MLHRERLSGEAACSVHENYDTEDIREFAQEILEGVVRGICTANDPQITQITRINGRPGEIGSPKLHRAGKKAQKTQNVL